MENMTTPAVIVVVYLAIMLAVGIYASRFVKDTTDFLLAGRKMGLLVLIATLCATHIGGGNIIGTASNGYAQGLSGMAFGTSTGMGMLVLGFFFAKPMRKLGICTICDYVYIRYRSNTVRILTSLFSLVALIGILAAQVGAITGVISVFGFHPKLGAVISVLMIIVYTALAGMWAVALTDVIQIVIVFIGLPLTTILGLHSIGGWDGLRTALETMNVAGGIDQYMSPIGIGIPAMLGFILPMIAYDTIGQDFYQRLMSAKNENIAKTAAIIAGVIMFVFGINSAVVGMLGKAILGDNLQGSSVVSSLAIQVLPAWAGGVLIAALIAAVMSTADSVLLASTSHVINDFYVEVMNPGREMDQKKLLALSKTTTVGVGLIALAVSLLIPGIIRILIYSYTIYCSGVCVPVVMGMLWEKGTAQGALWSIVAGGAVGMMATLKVISVSTIPPIVLGVIASFVAYVAVSLLTGKDARQSAAA